MAPPELAIIVTSYQRPWHLRWVLESIGAQQTPRRLEVVVTDDGSLDETADVVADFAAQAPFPVRFVTHPHHGFRVARCRNEGVRHSTAPHLLFVDGDCLLPPTHAAQHLAAWRPGVVTCGYCVRLEPAASDQVTLDVVRGGSFQAWATREQRKVLTTMHRKAWWYWLISHPTKTGFRSGDFSIARADLHRVNGFDENFVGWGCEDDDFGRRLRAAGLRFVSVLNRTHSYHLWHPPAPSQPPQWKLGDNVGYLQRKIRLTRCLAGCVPRTADKLTVRMAGDATDRLAVAQLLNQQGWVVEPSQANRADLELLCCPGRGAFGTRGDCRVLAVFDASQFDGARCRGAHLVLSPRADVGLSGQVRLRLDDKAGFRAVLADRSPVASSAAV